MPLPLLPPNTKSNPYAKPILAQVQQNNNAPKIQLPHLKPFGAKQDDDLEDWISSVQDHFAIAEVPKDKQGKYIGCYLEGNPLSTYRQADAEVKKLFQLLRDKHRDAWQNITNTDLLVARKQKVGE